jgi:glycerophosphoryl diester phosphodiesterase
MRLKLIFITLVLSYSCSKYSEPINNLNNGKIEKFGHAGMGIGQNVPMNSEESLVECLNNKMDGTELDVQLTKDSVLVAFHDSNLDEKTNKSGLISTHTWQELSDCYYDYQINTRYKLVRLDELFATELFRSKKFAFDIKLYSETSDLDYINRFARRLSAFLLSENLIDRCIIESSSTLFLDLLNQENSSFNLLYYPGTNFDDVFLIATTHNYDGITISTDQITKADVEKAHENNLLIVTWNTHSKKRNKEAVAKHPDYIETDEVKFLGRYLE